MRMTRRVTPQHGVPDRDLTVQEIRLVEERRQYLIEHHRLQMAEVGFLIDTSGGRGILGDLWLRELAFAKTALINGGQALVDQWDAIRTERDLPLRLIMSDVHHNGLGPVNYRESLGQIITDPSTRTGPDAAAYGDAWSATLNDDLPTITTVRDQDAWYFYHYAGGDFGDDHHPVVTPRSVEINAMRGDAAQTLTFTVTGGAGTFTWALESAPAWATVSDTGTVTLAFPAVDANAIDETLDFQVTTTGSGGGGQGQARIRVNLANPSS